MQRRITFVVLGLVLVAIGTQAALAQSATRVSSTPGGNPANGVCESTSITRDGRFVAFASAASNLVMPDTNSHAEVFIYDHQTGQVQRVSDTSAGQQANGFCFGTALSDSGQYVAFQSVASNYTGTFGTFVKDRETGAIVCMSVRNDGTPVSETAGLWGRVSISADGRHVAFDAQSTLVANDSAAIRDVYVHDRDSDGNKLFDEPGGFRTSRISASSSGIAGNGHSRMPDMSPDGRFIVFESVASNIVQGDTNGGSDAFIHDRDADRDGIFDEPSGILTERVNVMTGGAQTTGASVWCWPSVSADGRFVAFHSDAANVVLDDTNELLDMFIRDRTLNETVRITFSPDGGEADGASGVCEMTDDARFVTFYTWAANLLPVDSNGTVNDLVVFDRLNGSIKLVNYTNDGQQLGPATEGTTNFHPPVLDQTGRFVAFSTPADLVFPPIVAQQAYLRERGPGFLADVDGAGAVNVDDLIAIILNWGSCAATPVACAADLDGSGAVDVDDLIMVILNWG